MKENNKKYKIAYVVSDLKRVGPTNQTLNIINNSPIKEECVVITLFEEEDDSMINDFKENNIMVISLKLDRITFMINGKKMLKKQLMRYDVQIVHSYGIKPDYICQKATNGTSIIHIITLRNYPKEDIPTRMSFIRGKIALNNHLYTLKKARYIIACSKTIQKKMKLDYHNINIDCIQNGVDNDKFTQISYKEKIKLRKKYNLDDNSYIYISTGSFIPRKRIDETIEAFYNLNLDNTKLLLLGDGPEYLKIYNKYKNNRNIIFVGKTHNVKEYLQLSNAFVSSSESEGLPNSVIEAISIGIPVLLSNIPQHIEVLEEVKYAGTIYKLGDVKDYTEKMKEIINFDNSKCDISKSTLTMQNMGKKYFEYYKEKLKEIQ